MGVEGIFFSIPPETTLITISKTPVTQWEFSKWLSEESLRMVSERM